MHGYAYFVEVPIDKSTSFLGKDLMPSSGNSNSRVSCQKGPTRHGR